jgi:hypothetical protein
MEVAVEHDTDARLAPSLAPEHDWAAAARVVRPALRPLGTTGVDGRERLVPQSHGAPGRTVVSAGPAGLPIVYVIPAQGFDVLVSVEHLLAWGVGPEEVQAAAMANLSAWSTEASWVDEADGHRRIVWSDWGEGMDAARILLAEVREQLVEGLAPARRIIVGLPERDLLIAAALAEGDEDFAVMFANYVADRARSADDPIDGRIFELVDGDLVELEPVAGR